MEYPSRKRTRLQNDDYNTPGAYFITICAHNHQKLFGEVTDGDMFHTPLMELSRIGVVVQDEIAVIETHYTNVQIDKYVVMPNHVHMIVRITARINPCPTAYDIPNIIGKFKAAVTRRIRKERLCSPTAKVWQFSYHDHIIRGQNDYDKIWEYIDTNVIKWETDCFYSQ